MKQKVTVYNLKGYIEKELGDKNLTTHGWSELAIISNAKGKSFITDEEGESYIIDDMNSKLPFDLTSQIVRNEDGSMSVPILPTHQVKLSLNEIINTCDSREVYLQEFIRSFGSRLERNYKIAINCITDDLGLNGEDYDNGRLNTKF